MNESRRAFTLIELMLVVAIMGLLGTISVGGYRAMRQGMEVRGVMQNVNQFIRNACQRAMIDGQPTAIYFWNETRQVESDDGSEPLIVVGHAVAVRRSGRVSYVQSDCLVDEFGDLQALAGMDDGAEKPTDEDAKNGSTTYMYKINGDENAFQRSVVGVATMPIKVQNLTVMMTDADWKDRHDSEEIMTYGYYLKEGNVQWNPGDAYGFAFADLTLPNNYIFGKNYSTDAKNPVKTVDTVFRCKPSGEASGLPTVYALRPGKKSGAPEAQPVGDTGDALKSFSDQNK